MIPIFTRYSKLISKLRISGQAPLVATARPAAHRSSSHPISSEVAPPCGARWNAAHEGEERRHAVRAQENPSRKEAGIAEARIEDATRLTPSAKDVIRQAMAVTGLAAGDLAYKGARRLLDEHQRMVLLGADRDAFIAAIERVGEPPARLVEALKRHRRLLG
jgi:uncharacterized protein (DUF1778 family)